MNHSSVKVLIADDDDVSCKILNAMLNCHGYKSQCTSNGQECLNAMKLMPFDILLIDWRMPVMGGAETVALIRSGAAGEHHKDIPIIAITADLIMSPRIKCIQAGATRCLYKPIDFKELISVFENELNREKNKLSVESVNEEIDSAKTGHMQFVNSIMHNFKDGQMIQPENIPDQTTCDFGKWYFTYGIELYRQSPDFKEIDSLHQKIHKLARQAFSKLNPGDRLEVEKAAHEIEELSSKIVTILDNLKVDFQFKTN
jgi:CheY-like chemotaxis protein